MLLGASPAAIFLIMGAGAASVLYTVFAIWAVSCFRRLRRPDPALREPVTILKPVCGLDPGLYGNLRSFCEQDWDQAQIVFGVRNPDDPAIAVIRRVMRDFPDRDLSLVIDERTIGPNLKVSNLANMFREAKHDILIIADSDMRVGRDYLKTVVAPFSDPGAGAVTCLYKGSPVGGLPSLFATMFINDWFAPSVLVARSFQELRFCFGATMAVRRSVLQEIGGFEALVSHIADDYMLGKLVSDRGHRVELVPYVVENVVLEPSLKTLIRHELRWARTVRSVKPLGYAFSFLTNPIPLALFALLLTWNLVPGLSMLGAALGARILLHHVVRRTLRVRGPAATWLVPVRDMLSLGVWACSFFGSGVHWREHEYSLEADGHLALKG